MIKEKQSVQNVKVPEDLKKAFASVCENLDTTASKEIRQFMRDYVKKHGQGTFKF